MIYKKLRNALRGSVRVSVECAMPERVLNLCAAHQVPFWELTWQDEIHLSFITTRTGSAALPAIAEKTAAHLHFGTVQGVSVAIQRLRRRYVLLVATAIFFFCVWYGNTYIWAFRVTGNETVSEKAILQALEKQGIHPGIRGASIDQDVLRNHVLLELPDLSWIAVNVKGCTAHVQVVERHRPGELIKDQEYRDVVACRDGLITKVEALRGQSRVQAGDTVMTGQTLISGTVADDAGGFYLTRGMGTVEARTWYTFTVAQSLSYEKKCFTGSAHTRRAFVFGKKRINFPIRGSTFPEDCDKIIVYQTVSLPFGIRLPLTVVKETYTPYVSIPAQRSIADAQALAEQALLRELSREMTTEGEVVSTTFSAEQDGTTLFVTLTAECREQIGQSTAIR